MEALEKKMVQLENELSTTTSNLENSIKKLEDREKALQNVSDTTRQCSPHDGGFHIKGGVKEASPPRRLSFSQSDVLRSTGTTNCEKDIF